MDEIEVVDNPAESRFEARIDGGLAGISEYHDRGSRRVFIHTEVDRAFEGRGVGGALARGALDATRAAGLGVVPLCPFIKDWIEHHPDYADLVVD
jgi:hypothetical protein